MNCKSYQKAEDYGPNPYVTNVGRMAMYNPNFRTALWTGDQMQMTLMSIPVRGEIGWEVHKDTEQMLRVEQGMGAVMMGNCEEHPDMKQRISMGDTVFVPAGTGHNIVNIGGIPLRLSSVYAPPHHPQGTVQRTKKEAERGEYPEKLRASEGKTV